MNHYIPTNDTILQFVAEAKRATFEDFRAVSFNFSHPEKPFSVDLEHYSDGLHYKWNRTGLSQGREIEEVRLEDKEGKLLWTMAGHGGFVKDSQPFTLGKAVYLLTNSLCLPDIKNPFRGPRVMTSNDLTYLNNSSGDIRKFKGQEEILSYKQGNHFQVYSFDYSGGIVE